MVGVVKLVDNANAERDFDSRGVSIWFPDASALCIWEHTEYYDYARNCCNNGAWFFGTGFPGGYCINGRKYIDLYKDKCSMSCWCDNSV